MAQSTTAPSNTGRRNEPVGEKPYEDLVEYLKAYAKEKPDVAALWLFGIGFVVGWKLKPW
jgi:hypothetical protein